VPETRKVYFETGEVENKKFFYSIHDDSNATMGDTIQVTVSPVTGFAKKNYECDFQKISTVSELSQSF